jgi:hypothetical protein
LEEGEVLPPKPIPRTQAAINRTDLATGLVPAAAWSSSGLSLPKRSRSARHHHITGRHKIISASVALYAHGASLLGSSVKIITPTDRSSYLARATDMLLRLQTSTRNRTNATQEDISTQPTHNTDAADNNDTDQPHHVPATAEHPTDHPTIVEDTLPTDTHI